MTPQDYYRLCDEAARLGIPVALDDPRAPNSIAALASAVGSPERSQAVTADIHCPYCGAYAHIERDDEGDEVAICSDDDCPHIVVAVLSTPVPVVRDPESWQAVAREGRRFA